MIVDFHTHTFPETVAPKAVAQLQERYGYPSAGTGILEDLLEREEPLGIDLAVLHAAATSPNQIRVINNRAAQLQEDRRVVAFGSLHPDCTDLAGEIRRLQDLGVTGIKFHGDFQRFFLDDPAAMRMYEAIGSDFLVLFHVGDRRDAGFIDYATPERLARVLDAFPQLRVVAAHLGGYRMWSEAADFLIGRPIYLDTSSAMSLMAPAEAVRLIRAHGVGRILWGTDYPMWDPADELAALRSLPLSDAEKELILGENARHLLATTGWCARPA